MGPMQSFLGFPGDEPGDDDFFLANSDGILTGRRRLSHLHRPYHQPLYLSFIPSSHQAASNPLIPSNYPKVLVVR